MERSLLTATQMACTLQPLLSRVPTICLHCLLTMFKCMFSIVSSRPFQQESLWALLNFAKVRRQLYCRAVLGEYSISRMYLRILFNMSIKCHFI